MKEFYKIDSNKEIHFIIQNKGYGKRFRILNKLRKKYEVSNKHLKEINDYNENNYPPRYYMNNGAIELIDYLVELEDFI